MQSQERIVSDRDKRVSVAEGIRRWGNASSITFLDQPGHIFCSPQGVGFIGYRASRTNVVVFGDPVCPIEDTPTLVDSFHDYCRAQNRSIVYLTASENFARLILERGTFSSIEIGHEIILDPMINPLTSTGADARRLRNKYYQSMRANMVVKEYSGGDHQLEQRIKQLGAAWVKSRRGPQIYLHGVNIFAGRENKRWFYAEHNGMMLGLIMLNRIDANNGWVINMVMLLPEAPKFTSEYLILSVLEILRAERCGFLSAGTMPSADLGRIENLAPLSKLFTRFMYQISKKVFKLEERQRYWKKFQPRKRPSFLLFSKKNVGFFDIYGIFQTMNTLNS
jgi:lysylphosphatidylglycerol synthetase-like protein (DUF2156 family)